MTMTSLRLASGSSGSGRPRLTRRVDLAVRRARESELTLAGLLALIGLASGAALYYFEAVSPSLFLLPMVVASLVLSPRLLPPFVAVVLTTMVVALGLVHFQLGRPWSETRLVTVAIVFLVGGVVILASVRRNRLGVANLRGESMLVDLRDRLSKQGTLPGLPTDWYGEVVVRSAGGSAFAGDFVVAVRPGDGHCLHVAVVDVSGKGTQAGTRSLLCSGAFGGLLGALPPEQFLPAANSYLLDQEWSEGFATAVHLSLDLRTGDFQIRSAGHPPAVQLRSGSGRWGALQGEGPVLGLIPDAEFEPVLGKIDHGDALLLFTDGLVETAERDLSLGLDRLAGQAERLLRRGFEGGARLLINKLESHNDDRLLLMLHRR